MRKLRGSGDGPQVTRLGSNNQPRLPACGLLTESFPRTSVQQVKAAIGDPFLSELRGAEEGRAPALRQTSNSLGRSYMASPRTFTAVPPGDPHPHPEPGA
jgi:hypothetical protein